MATTTNFYAPPAAIHDRRVVLPADEAHHARSVLRAGTGDEIVVVDGEGGWYRVEITDQGSDRVVGTILDERRNVREPQIGVTVGMAILSRRKRFETFVEKAVELGVHRIVPLLTAHGERDTIRRDRLTKVMVAALKQCRRSWLPELAEIQTVEGLVRKRGENPGFICHGGEGTRSLADVVAREAPSDRVLLLVGPEGGFADSEVHAATEAGLTSVSLGPRRLRAETAALAVLSAVTTAWG